MNSSSNDKITKLLGYIYKYPKMFLDLPKEVGKLKEVLLSMPEEKIDEAINKAVTFEEVNNENYGR